MGSLKLKMCQNMSARALPPDPTGGAYDAPPDRLVSWRGGYPVTISHLPQCVWHLELGRRSLKYLAPRTHHSFSF